MPVESIFSDAIGVAPYTELYVNVVPATADPGVPVCLDNTMFTVLNSKRLVADSSKSTAYVALRTDVKVVGFTGRSYYLHF